MAAHTHAARNRLYGTWNREHIYSSRRTQPSATEKIATKILNMEHTVHKARRRCKEHLIGTLAQRRIDRNTRSREQHHKEHESI
jgi:hypothetical protein